jgi:hypothetical protein
MEQTTLTAEENLDEGQFNVHSKHERRQTPETSIRHTTAKKWVNTWQKLTL